MQIQLEKPWAGWSSIEISDGQKDFIGGLSYIDDVIGIFLSKFVDYIDGEDVILTFDEEGTEFSIILKHYEKLMIISHRHKYELHVFDVWAEDIIKPVCEEILNNLEDWIKFDIVSDETEQEFKEDYKINKDFIEKYIRRINMWCPICNIVELERPKLKKTLEEIEEVFDSIMEEK